MTSKNLCWLVAGLWGTCAALNLTTYTLKPQLANISLISEEAKQVEQYSGNNPTGALDTALERISIVKSDNPTYASEITELESKVVEARNTVTGTEVTSYAAQLGTIADDMESFADDHTKNSMTLVNAGLDVLLTGMWGFQAVVQDDSEKRRSSMKARQRSNAAARQDNDIWHNTDY
jgi:hypothetical protein